MYHEWVSWYWNEKISLVLKNRTSPGDRKSLLKENPYTNINKKTELQTTQNKGIIIQIVDP